MIFQSHRLNCETVRSTKKKGSATIVKPYQKALAADNKEYFELKNRLKDHKELLRPNDEFVIYSTLRNKLKLDYAAICGIKPNVQGRYRIG